MNQPLKTILISVGTCIITIAVKVLLFQYVLISLGDWSLKVFKKYLMVNITNLDQMLLMFFPIIIGLQFLKQSNGMKLMKLILKSILSVYLMIGFGLTIALLTWTSEGSNPLLPNYIKYQPFQNYWTIFIVLGILIPISLYWIKEKRNNTKNIT